MVEEYKILVEKEFNKISRDKPTIGLVLMLKNEEARVHVTLESVIGHVDAIIVYDTGSTDKTVEIVQNFCDKHKINLYMIQGQFVNFSTSRNVSLEYADKIDVHYLLLLDCNDELRGGKQLRALARDMLSQPNNGFLVCQQWWSGALDKYYNMRFVKARCGWRYRGSVHEWMKDTTQKGPDPAYPVVRLTDEIVLYQDRTKDNNKSGPRYARDKVLLLQDYQQNPHDGRTLFYLAQTCMCLNDIEEALYYSKLRLEEGEFEEERFLSLIRCGDCCQYLNHDWYDAFSWYMKAYEHTQRVEPLIKIADHYRKQNKWHVAYMYISEACTLQYPEQLILFVDRGMYEYYRWHVMSVVASHIPGKFNEGKAACLKALEHSPNKPLDEDILNFYNKKEKEVPVNKKSFIESQMADLRVRFPRISEAQLLRRAEALWKKNKKK